MEFAYIRDESGFDTGLTCQVSADAGYFPSLVWAYDFATLFSDTLLRADSGFGLCGVCELPSECWTQVARSAEETEDRIRSTRAIPSDIAMRSSELSRLLKSTGGRRHVIEALQLTSRWLREAADRHPALTFYGV